MKIFWFSLESSTTVSTPASLRRSEVFSPAPALPEVSSRLDTIYMYIKLEFHGAVGGVTGSHTVLDAGDFRIGIDAGLFRERKLIRTG
jgi:hypothetical protein